jgi:predicted phosphodiesterase
MTKKKPNTTETDRYLVFSGPPYYASGGANDLIGSFHDKEEAVLFAIKKEGNKDRWGDSNTWVQVYDLQNRCFLYKSEVTPHGEPEDFEIDGYPHKYRKWRDYAKTDGRVIVIGDVHGCLEELDELLLALQIDRTDRIIFCGDLVDKGPDSAGVVRRVRNLTLDGFNIDFVQGNHEENHLRWMSKPTLAQKQRMKRHEMFTEIHAHMNSEEKKFLETSELYVHVPDRNVTVVHAGIPPNMKQLPKLEDVPNMKGKQRDFVKQLLRIRYVDGAGNFVGLYQTDPEEHTYWAEVYDGRFGHVFYGHQPYLGDEVREWDHASGIDLGCVYGGYLCAAVNEPGSSLWHYIKVKAKDKYAEPLTI